MVYMETIKRPFTGDQTIEPTHVAGFNQFFDDFNGTLARRYGFGLDGYIDSSLYSGFEVSRRDLVKVPIFDATPAARVFKDEKHREELYRAYLYWTPSSNWAVSAEYQFERFDLDERKFIDNRPSSVDTMSIPFQVSYFNPSGFFSKFGVTFVRQELALDSSTLAGSLTATEDEFAIVDVSAGYRLPKRWGIIAVTSKNLLDEKFFFHDDNFRSSQPARNPRYNPERTFFVTMTFNY